MSELGNKIKTLRGNQPQGAFAKKTGLSLRTICKLEAGEAVRLQTVQQIARSFKLTDTERMALIVSWLKLELGEDFQRLLVEVRDAPAELKESDQLLGKIQMRLSELPRKQQEQLYLALYRPEVVRCLHSLNELYDALTRKPAGG